LSSPRTTTPRPAEASSAPRSLAGLPTALQPELSRAIPPAARSARAALLAALAGGLIAVACGGCGSSSSGTSASPATVTPGSAPLYIDAVVTPGGALKTNALAVGRSLSGRTSPYTGLLKLLQGPTGKTPDYAREVKPWLGPEAGVFLSSVDLSKVQGLLGGEALSKALTEGLTGVESALLGQEGLPALLGSSSAQGALVMDTTDVSAAKSFLEAQAHSAGAHAVTYRGVTYQVAPDGTAEGIVHKFAVIGSEAGLKSVIDTADGGPSLAHAAAYSKLTATAESGRLTNAYLDTKALKGATTGSPAHGEESLVGLLDDLLGQTDQVYLSAIPAASSLALDADTLPAASSTGGSESGSAGGSGSGGAAGTGESGAATSGAQVLRGLPGGAWLAIGVGDLDKSLGNSAAGLQTLASLVSKVNLGTISFAKVFAPLSSHSLNVQRDLLSWMGATGVYVSGSSVLNLQGAVVITSKDPARSRAALGKLAQAYREAGGETSPTSVPGTEAATTVKLPNFPLTLTMAVGQGKFVFGLGPSSIEEALSPQSTLESSSTYSAAASALGQGLQPSALAEVQTFTGLIESLGLSQASGFSGIASALKPLNLVSAGSGETLSNGVKRARLVLGLQQASG
jgi:hypothetical protein